MTAWTLDFALTQRVLDAIAPPDTCPEPAQHAEWHRTSETTRRHEAQGRPYPTEAGKCPYCNGVRT